MRVFILLAFAPALTAALALPRPTLARGGVAAPLAARGGLSAPLAVYAGTCAPRPAASHAARSRDVRMAEEAPFWENVIRFMRFGISSVLGLILGLLAPFTTVFGRTPALTAIGTSLALGVVAFFYLTLSAMESPPTETIGLVPIIEPSMQQMMSDVYGN